MKKILLGIIPGVTNVRVINRESKMFFKNAQSAFLKNLDKLKSEELIKNIETYNETNDKNKEILKTTYDVFKNNLHKYSFDQINKVIKLYSVSQLKDSDFNISILSYIIKRIDALPLPITVNVFHNLVKSGLTDCPQIPIIKEHILKNLDKLNSLDLTIVFNAFTILQEQTINKSCGQPKVDTYNNKTGEIALHLKYSDLFATILQKIKDDEAVSNDLSVINAVLILNMMSRINMCNYDIFKIFTKKYFKNLKEKDLEPHHYTLLLNSFAKCNIHINILKYIIKHMNNEKFITNLSYVNIMNALHYMAKFNFKNKHLVHNLKKRVTEIIDVIPQRELSNIVWAISKLKHNDPYFYFIVFKKMETMKNILDPMSIAQVLDALRRCRQSDNKEDQTDSIKINQQSVEIERETKNDFNNKDIQKKVNNNTCDNKIPMKFPETNMFNENEYNQKEKEIIDLLIKRYLDCIENCSLHVLTQVPFCCLQLNCSDYQVYYKSLAMLKKKRKQMSMLNLIYAKYFIRIYIEKQENSFQKLPKHMKQFAKDILSSDG